MARNEAHHSWSSMYQTYIRSFYEDKERNPQQGHGTLKGITEKLQYLKDLGVKSVWPSPFYESPMIDGGYDISDHKAIHPDLGTMDDLEELVDSAHAMGMKVVADLVPNHTSDQHEWFEKSVSRDPEFDDYYIWHKGGRSKDGKPTPPNNWPSVFSIPNRKARDRGEMPWLDDNDPTPPRSAWRWHDQRGEWYLATFTREQPDVNWDNPRVREEFKNIERFWLKKGVDGFRVDVINHTGKDMSFADEEWNADYSEEKYANPADQLERFRSGGFTEPMIRNTNELIDVLRNESDGKNLHMILEAYMSSRQLRHLEGRIDAQFAATFNFPIMTSEWDAAIRKCLLDDYYRNLPEGAIGNQVNGNHDNSRLATRIGDSAARAAIMMNILLPGTSVIYAGEELNLHDGYVPPERVIDPNGLRDPERMPMLWDDRLPNAGFSRVTDSDRLWLPINQADLHLSVARQEHNPTSTLNLTRAAIRLSDTIPALCDGKYIPSDTDNSKVYAFVRATSDEHTFVLTNFSDEVQRVRIPEALSITYKSILSSVNVRENQQCKVNLSHGFELQPNESLAVIPNNR